MINFFQFFCGLQTRSLKTRPNRKRWTKQLNKRGKQLKIKFTLPIFSLTFSLDISNNKFKKKILKGFFETKGQNEMCDTGGGSWNAAGEWDPSRGPVIWSAFQRPYRPGLREENFDSWWCCSIKNIYSAMFIWSPTPTSIRFFLWTNFQYKFENFPF